MKTEHYIIVIGIFAVTLFGQKKQPFPPNDSYPTKDFINPLGIENYLSGNFAELRNNHFHAGIDIKTNGREGYNLYAVGDGYISRINVSPRGYGNAIYIDHPNGYTSVYAHMKKFSDKIENYVRRKQYEQESFAVTLYPEPNEFIVNQKDIIGLSGNSGGSFGPHLHFEIRHTETEEPVNPFFFGYDVPDTKKPSITGLYLYALNGDIGGKKGRNKLPSGLHLKTPIYASGKIGVGLKAYDQHNGAANNNGIYKIDVTVNSKTIFTYTANRFNYENNRAIYSLCDYNAWQQHKSWIYQCYIQDGNPLRMYSNVVNNGIIELKEGKKYHVEIAVSDYAGNKKTASYTIIGKRPPSNPNQVNLKNRIFWNKENTFKSEGISIDFPKGIFYEDFNLNYRKKGENHTVGHWDTPVRSYFTIAIKPTGIPSAKLDKAVVVRRYKYRGVWKKEYLSGEYKNGKIVSKSRGLGVFAIGIDDTKPTIAPLNIKEGDLFKKDPSIRLKIDDRQTGIKNFDCYIDNQWIRGTYDKKYKSLKINLIEEKVEVGNHLLEVIVWDEKNNTNTYRVYFRKG